MVVPVAHYCSSVWGYGKHAKIDKVRNKAVRLFLGVHRFAANSAINIDMGWPSARTLRWLELLRFWNRLQNMCSTAG